jgi:hypothetical protein
LLPYVRFSLPTRFILLVETIKIAESYEKDAVIIFGSAISPMTKQRSTQEFEEVS